MDINQEKVALGEMTMIAGDLEPVQFLMTGIDNSLIQIGIIAVEKIEMTAELMLKTQGRETVITITEEAGMVTITGCPIGEKKHLSPKEKIQVTGKIIEVLVIIENTMTGATRTMLT